MAREQVPDIYASFTQQFGDKVVPFLGTQAATEKTASLLRGTYTRLFDTLDAAEQKHFAREIEKVKDSKVPADWAAVVKTLGEKFKGEFGKKEIVNGEEKIVKSGQENFLEALGYIYEQVVAKSGAGLSEGAPGTWEELMVLSLRKKAQEILKGESKTRIEIPEVVSPLEPLGTHEEEPKLPAIPAASGKKDDEFEEWRRGWFEGEIDLIRKTKEERICSRAKKELAENPNAPVETLPVFIEHFDRIDNLDDLREVACIWMAMMFTSHEVQEESYREKAVTYLQFKAESLMQQAETSGDKMAFRKAQFAERLIRTTRDFYVFWQKGWMGSGSGEGIGVSFKSIATLAAKIFDDGKILEFFMQQKEIAEALHTQTIDTGENEQKELYGRNKKTGLWNAVGRRLRRCSGQAVYDSIPNLTDKDYTDLAGFVLTFQGSDDDLQIEIANRVFKMKGAFKPHTVDYQLFLIYFMDYYTLWRYKGKYTRASSLIEQANHNMAKALKVPDGAAPGFNPQTVEDLKNDLKNMFETWSVGDLGAYGLFKRPDTSQTWIDNLKFVAFSSSVIQRAARDNISLEVALQRELPAKKHLVVVEKGGTRKEEDAKKTQARLDEWMEKTRGIYSTFIKDGKVAQADLDQFLKQGLNFGMKMISLFEPEVDRRSKEKGSYSKWQNVLATQSWMEWNADSLLDERRFDTAAKTAILSNFLDEKNVIDFEQHEIIRNNLIRTQKISKAIASRLRAGQAQPIFDEKSAFDIPISQEFIDLDELFYQNKDIGLTETWMRHFSMRGMSENAAVIYWGYVGDTRDVMYQVLAKETSPGKLIEVGEILESSKVTKNLLDTAIEFYNPETKRFERRHTIDWKIERMKDAVEHYVSGMFMLSIIDSRKNGDREQLVEYINQSIQKGVNNSKFKQLHFEPALSETEKANYEEVSYIEIEKLQRLGNDTRLRLLFNLAGFESVDGKNQQREIWEKGYLANLNGGKLPNGATPIDDQKFIDYETVLLMAGLDEREIPKPGEVQGYRINQKLADMWFDYYRDNPSRIPQIATLAQRELVLQKARNFQRFKALGWSDDQIIQSLNQQFAKLYDKFNDPIIGIFGGIITHNRHMAFIWGDLLDTYVQNTLDKKFEVMQREAGPPPVDYMAHEQAKCVFARMRKFAIEGGEGFDNYIVAQIEDKTQHIINPYDEINYEKNPDGSYVIKDGYPICKNLHGIDEMENLIIGSGEVHFGSARRLTRLPTYWHTEDLTNLIFAIFSAGAAEALHMTRGAKDWEQKCKYVSIGKRIVKVGDWALVITPEDINEFLEQLKDPGGDVAALDPTRVSELQSKNGCTERGLKHFDKERTWLRLLDLKKGSEREGLVEAQKEMLGVLDEPLKLFTGMTVDVAGKEIGGFLQTQVEKFKSPIGMTAFGCNVGIPLGIGLVVSAVAPVAIPITAAVCAASAGITFAKALSLNDLQTEGGVWGFITNDIWKAIFEAKTPWYKSVAKNNRWWKNVPFFGTHWFFSVHGARQRARDIDLMKEGVLTAWDSVVDGKKLLGMMDWYKKHARVGSVKDMSMNPGGAPAR